jgi:hypothetical protein
VRFEKENVWLNQYQLAELLDTDRTSILKHLKQIYETGELDEKATCAKIAQVRREGQRDVTRRILHYNLDAIIAVGYRVNSNGARSSASGPRSASGTTWCRATPSTKNGSWRSSRRSGT